MNPVTVAICGAWGKAEKFAGMVNEYKGCNVAAFWDRDPEKTRDIAGRIGCRAVTDIDEIMNDPDIQAVMIITENDLHADLALKACRAGKHIFVEKPVTRTLKEALEVKDAVLNSGVKFFMTDPFVGRATIFTRKLLDEGKLGKPVNCNIRLCDKPYPFKDAEEMKLVTDRFGGGMLADRGVHILHVIRYLFGLPVTVFARFGYSSEEARRCGREEYVTMIMDYPDDFTVSVFVSMNASNFNDGIEITCTGGCINDTDTVTHNGLLRWRIEEGGEEPAGKPDGAADPLEGWTFADDNDLGVVPCRHVIYWLRMILEDISQEQLENDPLGNNGLSINGAVDLMRIREAAVRSAEQGVPVKVL